MTLFLVALGLLGEMDLAAEVGIVQGASLALFLAFSSNARNLLLRASYWEIVGQIVRFRLLLFIPLSALAWFLASCVIDVAELFAVLLLVRRSTEWLAELQISEREMSDDYSFAFRFVSLQGISFCLLLCSILFDNQTGNSIALILWAVSPLMQVGPFLKRVFSSHYPFIFRTDSLFNNLGSSWIIAVSVYVFRALILLLAGKFTGGILIAAFALGGMVNALYTYAIGPTLARHKKEFSAYSGHSITRLVAIVLMVVGSAIAFTIYLESENINNALFILTVGCSLTGSGIMILAQERRIHLIQVDQMSSFVPDVLANIILIATIPFVALAFGSNYLSLMFLWSASLTWLLYFVPTSSVFTVSNQKGSNMYYWFKRENVQPWVLLFVFLPLFFQLDGSIFSSPLMIYDSQGKLMHLPLPFSLLACFIGAALLIKFDQVVLATKIIFFMFVCMLFSTVISTSLSGGTTEIGRYILLIQFLLPFFALLLGQSYISPSNKLLHFEAIALYVLLLIIPFQIIATLLQSTGRLSPWLWVFSVYQHLQYVPVVFVTLYFLALTSLHELTMHRNMLLGLAMFMGIYAVLSFSTLAIALVAFGLIVLPTLLFHKGERWFAWAIAVILAVSLFSGFLLVKDNSAFSHKFEFYAMSKDQAPVNVLERIEYWNIYIKGIFESPQAMAFGHPDRLERSAVPSAHNYYLDLAYNFGVLALLPLFYLIYKTASGVFQRWRNKELSLSLIVLICTVAFFVFVDNSLKVGFRQPWPGIIMFFLWGVLLLRLNRAK